MKSNLHLLCAIIGFATFASLASAEPVVRYSYFGTEAGENLGQGLACMPRFSSGGTNSDIIIGRPGGGSNGRVTLFDGEVEGVILFEKSSSFSGGQYGYSVAALGDVNADGFSDFIVGDPISNNGEIILSPNGASTVFFNNSILGPLAGFGTSLDGLFADANANGINDFIVGAPSHDGTPGTDIGNVSVHDGQTGISFLDIEGTSAGLRLGQVVASINDYDSDNIRDVLVSAPGFNSVQGAVYVYSSESLGAPLLTILGASGANSGFGEALSVHPDANGDGRQDILVGAPSSDIAGTDAGDVSLYNGQDGSLICRIDGTAGEFFGSAVAPVGDQNGDGREDFAIGAPGFNNNLGRVYIYTYSTSGACEVVYSLSGTVAGARFGSILAGSPGGILQCDIDNDKKSDFLVGTKDGTINEDAGSAYAFVHPSPTPTVTPTAPPTTTPTLPQRLPSSGRLTYRIDQNGTLQSKVDLNRDPAGECTISLFGRRTTSDRLNRASVLPLLRNKTALQSTNFEVRNLRKARCASAGKPYLFHMIAQVDCTGGKQFFTNVFSRRLVCGLKPPVSIQDWESQIVAAFNPSAAKKKSTKSKRSPSRKR